jgi:BirA family biotin operon repressor/biotin-[acetyl-CoA-carboxylase] ligase
MSRPSSLISRLERFERIDSTQRVVRGWLDDGVEEVCVAVADEQTAGRGRLDRVWQARPGRALLLSCGFRPTRLAPRHGWRLVAVVSRAMLAAAADACGAAGARLALKWPNDIVATGGQQPLKVAGVLAESTIEGGQLERAVVGIGVNVDWPPAEFPPELVGSMTSLRELSGASTDREALLVAFLERLGPLYGDLRRGLFDAAAWAAAQVATGALVEVDAGTSRRRGRAVGHDPDSGALLLDEAGEVTAIEAGEVAHCRLFAMEERL